MRTIFFVLAALPFCATSHAVTTITADGVFEVEFVGGDEGPIIDPPFTGEGSWEIWAQELMRALPSGRESMQVD